MIERGDVARAKPEPDLFLACQEALGVEPADCYVVGDAVWDLLAARRARMLSIGLLSGGYGEDELLSAGAFRVYQDAAELHRSLDELGFDALTRVRRSRVLGRSKGTARSVVRAGQSAGVPQSPIGAGLVTLSCHSRRKDVCQTRV